MIRCYLTFLHESDPRLCPWTILLPETHIKRQVTQHDCLSSLLGDGGNSVWWGKTYFIPGGLQQPRQDKNLLYWAQRAKRTNQGRAPFIGTPWVPIDLSFKSQQGPPPSLVFMIVTYNFEQSPVSLSPAKFCTRNLDSVHNISWIKSRMRKKKKG